MADEVFSEEVKAALITAATMIVVNTPASPSDQTRRQGPSPDKVATTYQALATALRPHLSGA